MHSLRSFQADWSRFFFRGNDIGYGIKSRSVGPTQQKRFELSDVTYRGGQVAFIDLPPNVEIINASVFWVRKNNKLEKFSNERQFLKIFPEYKSDLIKYIKKENIKFNSPENVIRLGNYYNEIIKQKV